MLAVPTLVAKYKEAITHRSVTTAALRELEELLMHSAPLKLQEWRLEEEAWICSIAGGHEPAGPSPYFSRHDEGTMKYGFPACL